jgi:thioesterase domain-containing protein
MTVVELVTGLRERGVRLWVEGDRLKCSAPAGVIGAETRAEVAGRKDEIIALLRYAERLESGPRTIVPLKAEGHLPPLFAVPGHNGDVFCYVGLARHLDAGQPLLGVQPAGLDGSQPLRSIEELASHEIEQIRRHRPEGPYLLVGYCAGGTIAFEIARQLTEQGEQVAFLALIATSFPTRYRLSGQAAMVARYFHERARFHLASGTLVESLRRLLSRIGRRARQLPTGTSERRLPARLVESRAAVERATIAALGRYRQRRYQGTIDVFLPSEAWRSGGGRPDRWKKLAGATREHVGPDQCTAESILMEPHVPVIAAALRSRLREIAGGGD